MASIRQEKVARMLQRDLSELLQQQFKHLAPGAMISVTVVRVAEDLGSARVYLSIFPNSKQIEALESIKSTTKEIRMALAARVKNQMRKVPELYFYLDDSFDYAQRIDQLLKD